METKDIIHYNKTFKQLTPLLINGRYKTQGSGVYKVKRT